MKRKKETLLQAGKEHAKLGIVSMGGMAAMGALTPLAPGSGAVVPLVGTGLALANLGRAAKTATQTLPQAMGYKPLKMKKMRKLKWR